mgnify:CR=1 FL=1
MADAGLKPVSTSTAPPGPSMSQTKKSSAIGVSGSPGAGCRKLLPRARSTVAYFTARMR